MSYPLSSAVSAGDPTLASQFNNLRLDALHLGQAAADAVNIAALLERYETRLTIVRLNTTQLRVTATATTPVSLLIAGYMCQAVANVDLAIGDAPSGAAATYYVFAERVGASTSFVLKVSTISVENAGQRRIGVFYWDGTAIVKDSIITELAQHITSLLSFKESHLCEGRLTLSTGVPVSNLEVASSSIVYFTPYGGNRIALYVPGYGWRHYTFAELILDISLFASSKNHDVFIYDNAGTLTLAAAEWSNATLRATALAYQDGVLVKSGSPTHRYLGTFYTHSAGVTRDTWGSRLLWNNYNRAVRNFLKHENAGTASWTQGAAGVLSWNNSAANYVDAVFGLDEVFIDLFFMGQVSHSSATAYTSLHIAPDAVNTFFLPQTFLYGTARENVMCHYGRYPGLGYHVFNLCQYTTAATATFYGTVGTPQVSGAYGWILS